MKKPILLAIDDDAQVLRAVVRDLRSVYGKDYRILSSASAKEALDTLKDLKNKNETVALFLSDQRMPEMLGVEFLKQARTLYPEAKRVLLTAYSDTEAAIRAINDVQLDYYLMKPWDPPEEKLYPVLNDQLDEWQNYHKPVFQGIRVLGFQWSPKSHVIKDFLSGNMIPYQWLDIEASKEARELATLNSIAHKDLPAVFFEDGSFMLNPGLKPLGERTGMRATASKTMYDVAIIGAGPSGLAAAVYGASEGLNTALIEKRAPGGQAGTSSRIENYLGFPNGLSGAELSRRAISQATRFGVEFLSPLEVVDITLQDKYKIITLSDGNTINARSVIITTGVDYRTLEAEDVERFTGSGIYYGAATTEAHACREKDIYVVGGGNSAGQAAMYLSAFANHVFMVIRKKDLSSTMSQYLIDQIRSTPNIHLIPESFIGKVYGNERLEEICIQDINSGTQRQVKASALFIFIGARPVTDWIKSGVIKDEKCFIETGRDLVKYEEFKKNWKLHREPFLLETSSPGIFAAGDVRSGAMNRVASAVGEGAMAIKFVHEYLAEN
ncbi:FAD-dependent oxidoreductase [Fulvivirgaceae bacterium PWU4]|uniref:FAD-dependent oxidoreductase n=1 Tax=Chryseosolibacter histidini TaxID=2782349 RepID=A0AAP2GKY2_9BACT|nr:response regulator [Chryseosolibacter histidini]MBT1695273.1 FAD-dependent oxidoreductase [Chryseosolibacter histidini]